MKQCDGTCCNVRVDSEVILLPNRYLPAIRTSCILIAYNFTARVGHVSFKRNEVNITHNKTRRHWFVTVQYTSLHCKIELPYMSKATNSDRFFLLYTYNRTLQSVVGFFSTGRKEKEKVSPKVIHTTNSRDSINGRNKSRTQLQQTYFSFCFGIPVCYRVGTSARSDVSLRPSPS